MADSAHRVLTATPRSAMLLAAALALIAATGCSRSQQPQLSAEVRVILSEQPAEEVLESDPESDREIFTYAFEGRGKLRAITRYESMRLQAMADRDKGAAHVFRRKLRFDMYDDVTVEGPASSPGMGKLRMDFWVAPEACCGLTMSADLVVGDKAGDAADAGGVKFTCDWPLGRQMLIELPPRQPQGRWVWVLVSLQKEEEAKPVDPREGRN
ncbi:MAG: hypothetical protein GWP05_03150 [Anaerolineaceae bacterium]|nr:hypothetical protein [Anaerolineaceae bacterium]